MLCQCGRTLSPNAKFCADCGKQNVGHVNIHCGCGVVLRSDQKFCFNCGVKVNLQSHLPPVHKVCSATKENGTPCGYTLISSLPFCPSCGTKAEADVSPTPPIEQSALALSAEKQTPHSTAAAELASSAVQCTKEENANGQGTVDPKAANTLSVNVSSVVGIERQKISEQFHDNQPFVEQTNKDQKTNEDHSIVDQSVQQTASAWQKKDGAELQTCLLCSKTCDPGMVLCSQCEKESYDHQPKQHFSQYADQPMVEKEINFVKAETHTSNLSVTLLDRTPSHDQSNRSESTFTDPKSKSTSRTSSIKDIAGGTKESQGKGHASVSGTGGTQQDAKNNNNADGGDCEKQQERSKVPFDSSLPQSTGDEGDIDDDKQKDATSSRPIDPTKLPLPINVSEKDEKDKENDEKKTKKSYADVAASQGAGKQENKGCKKTHLAGTPSANSGAQKSVNILKANNEKVAVVFHVIISKDFACESASDVYMVSAPQWKDGDKLKMNFVRRTSLGDLYQGRTIMTKEARNNGFEYKYCTMNKKKFQYEELLKRGHKEGYQNRMFAIPVKERPSSADVHRYDGVAYSSVSEGFFDTVRGTFGMKTVADKIRKDAMQSAKEYLPSIEEIQAAILQQGNKPSTTAEDLLLQVKIVMSTLRLQLFDARNNIDDHLRTVCVRDSLVNPLLQQLDGIIQNRCVRTATLGMFVLVMIKENQIWIDPCSMNRLCRAMLIIPDVENKLCPDLEELETQFPMAMKEKKTLAESVVYLINKSDVDKHLYEANPSWLCCVPLLHFLEGTSIPFQDPPPSADYISDKNWWGAASCSRRKDTYKSATSYLGFPKEFLELIGPACVADTMFLRTIVASLDLDALLPVLLNASVPIDATAGALAHHIRSKSWYQNPAIEQLKRVLRKMVKTWQEENVESPPSEMALKKASCLARLISEMHKEVFCPGNSRHFDSDMVLDAVQLMFMATEKLAKEEDRLCLANEGVLAQDWRRQAKDFTGAACAWTVRSFPLSLATYDKGKLPGHLQVWGKLLGRAERLTHTACKQEVERIITENFEAEVNRLSPDDKLEVFLKQEDQVVQAFSAILNRLAFESLEEAFKRDSTHLNDNNIKLLSLQSALLEKMWQEKVSAGPDMETDGTFTFIVNWVPMVNYLKKFREDKNLKQLTKKAQDIIATSVACVSSVYLALTSGQIPIKMLESLQIQPERFAALAEAIGEDKAQAENLLRLRCHELKTYFEMADNLDTLLGHCYELLKTADREKIGGQLEKQRDAMLKLMLSDVSEIALPDSIKDVTHYKPKTNPWKLPDNVLSILPEFVHRFSSVIFRKSFAKEAGRQDLSKVDFWGAFQMLWTEVSKEWADLCKQMMDGSISLQRVEKIFCLFISETGDYKYTGIESELQYMSVDGRTEWIDERINQFQCFTQIKKYVQAAKAILEVRKAYSIQGDFGNIDKICHLSQNGSLPIRDLDKSVLGLCKQLEYITPRDITCLEGFRSPKCTKFVQWLRENMKDGVKELNVFVDLAFISAGEEPMAIDRVNCFHAAATGYAPLIFTNIKTCDSLLQQCRLVFRNIDADKKLPQKLAGASQYLEWFQDVQKSHGSVEKTSLSQVSNINTRGVFRIGSVKQTTMTLHQVIRLDVAEDSDGKTPARKYSYEEMLDLQSRLMLVAGQAEKGKENVDRFITIMDSLVRLGKTYVQLCADGCVLYLDWSVKFLCDKDKPVCCISEFGRQEMMKGHRGKQNLEDFIMGMAAFLEQCHAEWLQYVDQKRKEFPELNVYSIEQLVFLQQQLVRIGSGEISKDVYPMLSLLKADCSPTDLESALQETMDEVDRRDCLWTQRRNDAARQEPGEEETSDEEKNAVFLGEMLDSGFPKSLALRALKEIGPDDIAGGIAWCMKHEDDSDTEAGEEMDTEEQVTGNLGNTQQAQLGQRLKEWVTRTESITQSAIRWLNMEQSEQTTLTALTDSLRMVWRKFLETVSSSGTDFFSLEHLGIILKCLAAKDARVFNRSLPPNFNKPGTPNLIICPRNEVLNAVTYMYMFPENSEPPLPQADEVLLCTDHTTFQQVDIFLRRAFFGKQQKIYCLAFADSLDYDVGERTEKKIKEYTTEAGDSNYKLVVVCTTENEYRARIVAALEKYRRPTLALSNAGKVRAFLCTRFAGPVDRAGQQSASCLDSEFLCVRVVKSYRSGVGKTLYKQRQEARLKTINHRTTSITIPLHSRVADTADIASRLLKHTLEPGVVLPRIIHLDISYQVQEGVDHLLYNLLVLGCVTDSQGHVWLRSPVDLYLVEAMPLLNQKDAQRGRTLVHQILDVLPSLNCWSPQDSFIIMKDPARVQAYQQYDQKFDKQEFSSEMFQRPYQYLQRLDTNQQPQAYTRGQVFGQEADCLAILLKYCGVQNPSWSELTHFVCFLNKQLQDFEHSVYCGMATSEDLPGFSVFVLRFLIQMSRDFATRSLKMSEESLAALTVDDEDNADIEQYEMRRTWESSPHPYIFFNPDEHSMTFLGFSIDAASGNLMDQQTGQVLVQAIMNRQLYQSLILNRVPLMENFDVLPREDRLLRLYRVLGLRDEEIFENNEIIDPDDTYELTTDNVKKILAIYMRFRCNIPVIVMGETGCGKTRLVEFLCALQTPGNKRMKTMVKVKVHGGTTGEDIMKKVRHAETVAQKNAAAIQHRPVYTVLFFDEANTTEAVGVIKEVMCDSTMDGQPVSLNQSLKMVAACNPYRKHSDELIQRLENAGLGYHVDADKTVDKLGRVPMRRLVYRVQPLPQSMLPLVWDFGQLNTRVEELYIRQMVRRYVRNGLLAALNEAEMDVMCRILINSQDFMRQQQDECSFVSLRDVDRALTVTSWFMDQAHKTRTLFLELDAKLRVRNDEEDDEEEEEEIEAEEAEDQEITDMTRALVLALGVCYRACLRSKDDYDTFVVPHFRQPFHLPGGKEQFLAIIDRCQEVFLDDQNIRLEDNIARNQALKENVFMMVVCIELRIPLFLVGKPGSSKSLAKTIVADAMQGNSAYSDLFRELKQAQMVSFQCSPLATADGILGTFRQCAQFQKGKDINSFVSVVVLDEVGLAEDSPKMPLKTLHPLLEDGCPGDEVPEACKKVAFIGISNWALDPAKMNRGILVQRDVPDDKELIETAKGICTTRNQLAFENVKVLIPKLAEAYRSIFKEAKQKREFFGLRDFYSLVKMVYAFAAQSNKEPTHHQLIAAIRRNFGGLDAIDPLKSFRKLLPGSLCPEEPQPGDPDCTPSGLIKAALRGDDMGGETRYLLLLSENYGGLTILSENLLADRKVVRIFGSSFPKDQEYTQICRNINRIKVCMETGQTVILLNLDNLYESLYDALNQYYAMLGGERYVDLGLGTHRVKCRVHRDFRLIVVAEKQAVYDNFPIPLINRLEKHFLTLNNIMTQEQLDMAEKLEKWADKFISGSPQAVSHNLRNRLKKESVGDVFMGYHPDAAPAIVLKVWDMLQVGTPPRTRAQVNKVLEECQRMLLWCATPDAVVRCGEDEWGRAYHEDQQHEHLAQYLHSRLAEEPQAMLMAQITTHSKLLTDHERWELCDWLPVTGITLLSLQSFDTEQQFCQKLNIFFKDASDGSKLLIVQCDSGDTNQNLIKCAQYCMQDLRPANTIKYHVVFIVQLPRIAGACFTGFLGGNWHCLHIDDLRAPDRPVPSITLLQSQTPATLLMTVGSSLGSEPMDVNSNNSFTAEVQREEGEGDRPLQHEMEVDVEDVHLDLQSAVSASPHSPRQPHHEWDQTRGFDAEYVQHLLTSCVQAAVALVRDPDPTSSRATHRIIILLELMEGNHDFFVGLHKMVVSILKEREEKAYQAECWLSKEAARLDTVKVAGTFRRAWQQCLENKVVPVLASVIAYLDTNANLDIICTPVTADTPTPTPRPAWVQHLWLGVLQDVCQLTYKHLRSMSDKDELEEFCVRSTGAGTTPISCQLPFSWLVWEHFCNAVSGAHSAHGDSLSTASSVVEQSALGQCLKAVVGDSENIMMQMFQFYIADLLHFTFPLSSAEHQVLCVCMEKGINQLGINLAQLDVGGGLVALHMLLDQMKPRLQSILDMVVVQPKAIQALMTGTGLHSRLLNSHEEMTEDVVMLTLLVEELKPRPNQLEDQAGCSEWMVQYSSIAPVILRVLSDAGTSRKSAQVAEGAKEDDEDEDNEEEENQKGQLFPFGDRCMQLLETVRCLWTKEMTLKLFLDFILPLRQGSEKTCKALGKIKPYLLFKLLEDDADMKSAQTLQNVDKFLLRANGFMVKGLLGKVGNCSFCDAKLETVPVELPCKHRLCNGCYRDATHGSAPRECPQCHSPIPQAFDSSSTSVQDREGAEQLGRYQRQVSGFLMALVSKLCFSGQDPPQPDAVKHIFGYIMHRSKGKRTLLQTKFMTVHDDLFDPTPVLRSFLLRLLIRHNENEVMVHLEEFLKNAREIAMQQQHLPVANEPPETPTLLEFSLLIIHCIENLHHEEQALRLEDCPQLNRDPQQLLFLSQMLSDLRHTLGNANLELTTLYSLGRLRYSLSICAYILQDVFVAPGGTPTLTAELEDLLSELELIVCHIRGNWAKKFLIKQLCRDFGMQSYMALVKLARQQKILEWVVLQESGTKVEEVPDRYLMCGEHYKSVRDSLAPLKMGGDTEDFMQLVQDLPLQADQQETLILLALHREVTMSNLRPMPEEVRTRMAQAVNMIVQECPAIQDKELGVKLCENRLGQGNSPMCVHPAQDMGVQSLICVLTHLRLALRPTANRSNLLHPLHLLVFQPAAMANGFLPTMPQDNLDEIMTATKERLWRCPNGHRYLIGDCGRPATVGRCNTCGAQIGGQGYTPAPQNAQDAGADQTQTGHILGQAGQRGLAVVPERQLSAIECTLVRFFTHAALYLGANIPDQADQICNMVHPRIAPQTVGQFFWEHLQHDLQVLQRVTGRGVDDVYLVLHHLCHQMAMLRAGGNQSTLDSKQERADWEGRFAAAFIAPTVQTIDNIVQKGNKIIVSDTRLGESELLKVVYEVEEAAGRGDNTQQLQISPMVWRYRPRITVDHFFREFHLQVEANTHMKDKLPIIRLFKAESHILRALHYVPLILSGQRRLMMQLHRRLDRAEAAFLTIQQVLQKKECSGVAELMAHFSKAWEIIKEHLIAHRCLAPMEGFVSLPVEFHNSSITESSPLAVLLPSTRGPGLCSYMLLQYLFGQHNQFLQRYSPLIKQGYNSLPEVSVHNITERHLVGCSPEHDILPMVLAHSNYSVTVGHAARLEYDFPAFQQQLQDTLLQCKARVQRHQDGYFHVETMVYRADTTSSRLFRILREKIGQESLSPAERRQILDDLRDKLPDICQSIDNLNTALSFLKALGGPATSSLHDFMATALRMKHTIYSAKAQQMCSLGHVQSLWILLCHQRASILAAHQQDAFDSQDKKLRAELSDDQEKELKKMCQSLSIERLELLLLQLFECIMLHLSEPQDQDDDTQPENYKLQDVLMTNLESPLYEQEPVEISAGLLSVNDLASFPESLLGRHSTSVWLACHTHLAKKRQLFN